MCMCKRSGARTLPLIPIPESVEFDAAEDVSLEPVPSDFFDDPDPGRDQFSKA